ncbi:hypothetical protein, partial [Bartonella sp. CL42QHWL]|uniref:hypothetical protein n=1 Tax=Bartonella sp. CL42QHWL TaxID=3243528 RepID=UPI0035CEF7EA
NLVTPSQGIVNPSQGIVNSSWQLGSTSNQLGSTSNQQNLNYLTDSGLKAKQDLEILVATGKSKDFLNKQITFNDLDNMTEKEILKHHRMYETKMAARLNDSLGKTVLKAYTKLSRWLVPIDDEDDLYHDLRNDYLITNELDKWLGWFSIKMGPLTALASTTLITLGHCHDESSMNTSSMTASNMNAPNTTVSEFDKTIHESTDITGSDDKED